MGSVSADYPPYYYGKIENYGIGTAGQGTGKILNAPTASISTGLCTMQIKSVGTFGYPVGQGFKVVTADVGFSTGLLSPTDGWYAGSALWHINYRVTTAGYGEVHINAYVNIWDRTTGQYLYDTWASSSVVNMAGTNIAKSDDVWVSVYTPMSVMWHGDHTYQVVSIVEAQTKAIDGISTATVDLATNGRGATSIYISFENLYI